MGKNEEPLGGVTCVSAGGIHSAAVVASGCVYTWGNSSYGQVSWVSWFAEIGGVSLVLTESSLGWLALVGSPRVCRCRGVFVCGRAERAGSTACR